jgi:hypothetical protein
VIVLETKAASGETTYQMIETNCKMDASKPIIKKRPTQSARNCTDAVVGGCFVVAAAVVCVGNDGIDCVTREISPQACTRATSISKY